MRILTARYLLPAVVLLLGTAVLYAGTAASAQDDNQRNYHVVHLSSLGGTVSSGSSIFNRSWIAGYSNMPGDETRQATLWKGRVPIELGTLGGPNSSVLWRMNNNAGVVAGIAETADLDPLGADWSCSSFFPGPATGHICLGFVWEDGVMKPLPTLGGNNGFAAAANSLGQVVGWAENTVEDETCNPPQVLQFRAVMWDTFKGTMQELQPLPGHTVSAATTTNNRGQVAGISGICDNAVGRFSAISAVLWDKGEVLDIGNLGGVAWNTPMAMNERGDIVGFSNHSADDDGAFNPRAFLWTERGGIIDLGTLENDTTSQALGINNRNQVVGLSCGEDGCRAFIWERGVMTDLNSLAVTGHSGHLVTANDINNRGEITGQVVSEGTGDALTFLATPRFGR